MFVIASLSIFTIVSKAVGIEDSARSTTSHQLSNLKWNQDSLLQSELAQPSQSPADRPDESKQKVDKSKYNLFNPTPRKYWRDFITDRPGKTETPFTRDAGNWSVEADLFIYTKNSNAPDGTITENYQVFVPNVKLGLTNSLDFQVIPEFYNIQQTNNPDGSITRKSGFGDVKMRMKYNLWGNDGGQTAFAILPYVKIPTNQNNLSNNSVEGGIILPLAIKLSDRWDVGINTGVALNRNEDETGYDTSFVNSVSFGYEINKAWATYFELATATGSQFAASFDTGLKYFLTEDIQLDASVYLGLSKGADNFQPFVGMSARF